MREKELTQYKAGEPLRSPSLDRLVKATESKVSRRLNHPLSIFTNMGHISVSAHYNNESRDSIDIQDSLDQDSRGFLGEVHVKDRYEKNSQYQTKNSWLS